MQGSASNDEDWSMSARRERAVMRDVPGDDAAPKGAGKRGSNIVPPTGFVDDFKLPTGRGILSKEEIQALLRPSNLPTINADEPKQSGERPLDLDRDLESRPDYAAAEGRRIAARLSRAFGQHAGLKAALSFHKAQEFDGFEATMTKRLGGAGAAYLCFGERHGDISQVIFLSPSVVDRLITVVCGGGSTSAPVSAARELSAIDCALLEPVIAPFSSMMGHDLSFVGIETDADFLESILPVDTGEEFCFTVPSIGSASDISLLRLSTDEEANVDRVSPLNAHQAPVTALLTARIASLSVPVSRLSNLKPGDTMLLGVPADQPVELLSGGRDGRVAFEGDVGRKGNSMAIRIKKRCQR